MSVKSFTRYPTYALLTLHRMQHRKSDVWLKVQNHIFSKVKFHVGWVPYHQGTVHPQVADGDDLQVWRVAANIWNKQ
jgi:hypothetical protein